MAPFTIAFFTGLLLFQAMPETPPLWLLGGLLCLSILVLRRTFWLGALGLGFAWGWWHADLALSERLPLALAGRDLVVTGVVVGLPEHRAPRWRFVLDIRQIEEGSEPHATPAWQGRARLSWRHAPQPLLPGQSLRLKVRLFAPNGFRNPGGFDYERWLYAEGIAATGYVRSSTVELSAPPQGLTAIHHQLRSRVREYLATVPGPPDALALLKALVIGDRGGFDAAQWAVFRATGTNHLVAISGLHLGFVAGLGFWLMRWLWRRSAWLCLRWPATHVAAVTGLLAALGYALLAGLSLPTQRALLMLMVGVAALLMRRPASPQHFLAMALLAVLLFDPRAPLQAGFWLSFGAVAAILLMVGGRLRAAPGRDWWRVQWGIAIALVPLLAVWGFPVSMVAPLVNLVAVPWFTLVIVPASLLGVTLGGILPEAGRHLLAAVVWLLQHTLETLTAIAQWGDWTWSARTASWPVLLLSVIGGAVLLTPIPGRLRTLGLAMLLPLLVNRAGTVPQGGLTLAVLDVGQGLSVVVQTARHSLVFDVGPRYSSDFNTAEAVVIPFLEFRGVESVDRLVLSHDDADHAGAWQAFVAAIPVRDLLAGQPEAVGSGARPCLAGERWEWDGVSFELVHPDAGFESGDDNDRSCVLRIDHPEASFLLAGDITKAAERHILSMARERVEADFVVVPHHGSATSSSQDFVAATGAGFALVSAGHGNRYGFPHPVVTARWRTAGAELLNTADAGAIIVDLGRSGPPRITRYREAERGYWHRSDSVPSER